MLLSHSDGPQILSQDRSCEKTYLAGELSDHNPLSITLTFTPGARRGGWRLSPGWLQHEQVSAQLEDSIKTYWSFNSDTTEPPVVWDAFKAIVRGPLRQPAQMTTRNLDFYSNR